jgi:hypothetical protein
MIADELAAPRSPRKNSTRPHRPLPDRRTADFEWHLHNGAVPKRRLDALFPSTVPGSFRPISSRQGLILAPTYKFLPIVAPNNAPAGPWQIRAANVTAGQCVRGERSSPRAPSVDHFAMLVQILIPVFVWVVLRSTRKVQ